VWWQGTLVLDGDSGVTGWFLDPVPPARAPLGDLGLGCMLSCSANQLVGNTIVVWDGSAPPRLQQCADLLGTRLGQRYVDVRTGDMACFMTEGRRVGYVTVASMSGPARMDLEVTVWRQP
jgi:hypothetical protein